MVFSTIHLVRHGEVHNPAGVLYGRLPRFRLSARGLEQAAAAGRWLTARPPAVLYTSPLLRARQTAAGIGKHLPGLKVKISRRLNEVLTPYQGQPGELIDARDGDVYSAAGPGFEQPRDIVLRAHNFFRAVLRHHPGRTVAAVTHGDVVTFMVLWAGGLDIVPKNKLRLPAAGYPVPYPEHASITTFVFDTVAPQRLPTVDYVRPW